VTGAGDEWLPLPLAVDAAPPPDQATLDRVYALLDMSQFETPFVLSPRENRDVTSEGTTRRTQRGWRGTN